MFYTEESYCGINCGNCPVLIANKNNMLEGLAVERHMTTEELTCHGCKSEQNTPWCRDCEIKKCAKKKNIALCFLHCDEYPCKEIYSHTNVPVYQKDAYCGLYCGACELFVATQTGTLSQLAQRRNIKPEDLECYGCKSRKTSVYCSSCQIKNCAKERRIEYCYQCQDYPCDVLHTFQSDHYPHKRSIFNNLQYLQENGVKQWLEHQKQRWNCPKCGMRFTYYADFCEQCGHPLDNCQTEADNVG